MWIIKDYCPNTGTVCIGPFQTWQEAETYCKARFTEQELAAIEGKYARICILSLVSPADLRTAENLRLANEECEREALAGLDPYTVFRHNG